MKIALVGNGNMGKTLQSVAKDQIVKVIESFEYDILEDDLDIDAIIDFSNRENLKYISEYSKRKKCKVLIATTNLLDSDYILLEELAKETAVMVDSNFSYGIFVLKKIVKENMDLLKNYDIELVEKHHKYKKDSPSGTMKSIESILKDNKLNYNVTSIRAGTLRGEHNVIFYGDEEYIEIRHVALSRKIYALGALESVKWLMCKEKGLFSYEDCILNT